MSYKPRFCSIVRGRRVAISGATLVAFRIDEVAARFESDRLETCPSNKSFALTERWACLAHQRLSQPVLLHASSDAPLW